MSRLRRSLILAHRYLGIALALLFLTWFLSGIAMIYARDMPRLTPEARLARLPPLDLTRVRLTARQAAARAGLASSPERVTLSTVRDRPAYRFGDARPAIVFADTGEPMSPAGERDSLAIAAQFTGVGPDALRYVGALDRADQWTITQRRQLPVHKIAVDDEARTEVYVSAALGEVVVQTTRATRALAWAGAIPHWLYFAPLRLNDALWRQVILWTAGLGTISVAFGLVLAVLQARVAYAGLLRWHYLTGAAFGTITLTWVFSGLLSMEPWNWAASERRGPSIAGALRGGSLDLSSFPAIDAAAWTTALGGRSAREIELTWIRGGPWFVARGVAPEPLLVRAEPFGLRTEPFDGESILDAIRTANRDAAVVDAVLIRSYDGYYYDRQGRAPLPVLRLRFDDPDRTWAYVDPRLHALAARFTRRERVQRWLYHGLHSLDFPFWYYTRAWEAGVMALLAGGAALSGIGAAIGWRRLRRLSAKGSRS